MRRSAWVVLVAAAGAVFAVLAAAPAAAHADLVDASPSPGTGLPQAPGGVVMRFTEPLNYRLSAITVLDESGEEVTDGATEPVEGDRHAMRRPLQLLRPGVYTVRWTTVSPLDGHTLKGSYRFGVATSVSGDERVRSDPIASEGLVGLVGRFAAFAGLGMWAGSVLLGRRLAAGLLPSRRLRNLALAGPFLAVAGTLVAAASSAVVSTGSVGGLVDVLWSGASGRYRLAVVGFGLVALAWRPKGGAAALGLAVAAVVADAAAGHAATASAPLLATGVFAAHLAAVGVWVFAIAASAAAATRVVAVLRALSPYAISAAAAVGLTGAASAALLLNRPGELLSTGYGQTVTVKAAVFGVMGLFGGAHWIGGRRGAGRRWLRVPVTGEAAAATVAVAVAAVLVSFPDPPRQAEASAARADAGASVEELADRAAVSVAEPSGPFVVALSVLPPDTGEVSVRLNVVGLHPGDAFRQPRLRATSPGGATSAVALDDDCGLGCFQAPLDITEEGHWTFAARAVTNREPIAANFALPLPAADGRIQLERAIRATESLETARMHETLRGTLDAEGIVSDYQFAAPNAMRYDIRDGGSIIFRDATRYRRDEALGRWEAEETFAGFTWPAGYYRSFWTPAAAVRLLSREVLDGDPTEVIAFLRPDISAWFRIWIGEDDGIVRRMEMRAQGHLMDQTYRALNEPLTIPPPD